MPEMEYPFYWRGLGGWGASYKGYRFVLLHKTDLLIYDPNGKRVHDKRYQSEQEAMDYAYTYATVYLGAPLPKPVKTPS